MASRTKVLNPKTYKIRFDFTSSDPKDSSQTATIKELLNELLFEITTTSSRKPIHNEYTRMDIRQLEPALRLLRGISGKPLKKVSEPHPIDDIRTIKALYRSSYNRGMHLIGLIEPPGPNSQAIMDLLISPPTEQSAVVLEAIRNIIRKLELGIPEDEKDAIDAILGSGKEPEAYRMATNEAIDKVLLTHLHLDADGPLLQEADGYLYRKTMEFMNSIVPVQRESRLHVATYVYLRALEFLHALNFDIKTNCNIPNDKWVSNRQIDFSHICNSITSSHGVAIQKDTCFMSHADVPAFCIEHASELAQLVSAATDYTYNKRDILTGKDINRARYALYFYLTSINLPSDENPNPIGIVHVVAAFCSVLHQRKMKTKPLKSRRYGHKLASPQKQLDAFIAREEESIPTSATTIYRERTQWYIHALLGRKHMADNHLSMQAMQSMLHRQIYMSLSHARIHEFTGKYRDHMVQAARDFISLHGKEETEYQWVHGSSRLKAM